MSKIKITDLIKKIKETKKNQVTPPAKKAFTDRDMRQEAIDMGAYGAQDIWGSDGTRN